MAASSELRLLLLLTVPYVQTEVLVFVGRRGSRGVAYDPLSTRDPVPWSSDCPECRAGRIAAPLKVRRAVQTLCTARMTSPNSYDTQVVVGGDPRYYLQALRAWDLSDGIERWAVAVAGKTRSQDLRSPVLRRTIDMLTLGRAVPATQNWLVLDELRTKTPHPHDARAAA